MKYCYKCGNPMEDDMLFCQKCGTKVNEQYHQEETSAQDTKEHSEPNQKNEQNLKEASDFVTEEPYISYQSQQTQVPTKTLRKSMKIGMIACLILAGFTLLTEIIAEGQYATGIGIGSLFAILAFMFFILAKSPKENMFILNRQSGMKKKTFVIVCIVIAFLFSMIFMVLQDSNATSSENTSNTTQFSTEDQEQKDNSKENETDKENVSDEKTTLSDIEKWYENQIPAVSQSLIEYAQAVNGISNVNVTDAKFRFGEDSGWYDCHYTVYFTCKVNGDDCGGEARAFLKYNDDQLTWFHFEIYRDSDFLTLVEQYDDSYDQIIEDYYKELESEYK